MYIDNVVHINMDEEYYYIEVGVTLYCSTITIPRDMELKVVRSPDRIEKIAVIVNIRE